MSSDLYPIVIPIIAGSLIQAIGIVTKPGPIFQQVKPYIIIILIIISTSFGIKAVLDKPKDPTIKIQNNPVKLLHDTLKVRTKIDSLLKPQFTLTPGTPLKPPIVRLNDTSMNVYFQLNIINNAIVKNVSFNVGALIPKNNTLLYFRAPLSQKDDDYLKAGVYRWIAQPLYKRFTDTVYLNIIASYQMLKQRKRYRFSRMFMVINDEVMDIQSDKVDTVEHHFKMMDKSFQ